MALFRRFSPDRIRKIAVEGGAKVGNRTVNEPVQPLGFTVTRRDVLEGFLQFSQVLGLNRDVELSQFRRPESEFAASYGIAGNVPQRLEAAQVAAYVFAEFEVSMRVFQVAPDLVVIQLSRSSEK